MNIPENPKEWDYNIYFDIIGKAMVSFSPTLHRQLTIACILGFAVLVFWSKTKLDQWFRVRCLTHCSFEMRSCFIPSYWHPSYLCL